MIDKLDKKILKALNKNARKKKLPLSNIERAITHIVLNVVKEEKRIPVT